MAGDGWRDLVKDAVAARATEARKKSTRGSQTANISRVGFSVAAHPFLVRAAKARGMSISGYIRRATMAYVARDLGMDPVELFQLDTPLTPPGKSGRWHSTRDLDGKLFGHWEARGDGSRHEDLG